MTRLRLLVIPICLSAMPLAGCASAQTLAYGSVTAACIASERAIVAREPTTLENDQRDLRSVRSVCDAILAHLGDTND